MEFFASAETFKEADPALDRARRCVEPFLNREFANSSLSALHCKLRYVPIVMPADMRGRYPARSKLRKLQHIYDCTPQLDYDVFVTGSLEQQLREYVAGLASTGPYLARLGATPDQINDFERILSTAVERILNERPDQTRH